MSQPTRKEKKVLRIAVVAAIVIVLVLGLGSLVVFTPEGLTFVDLLAKLVDVTKGTVLILIIMLVGWYFYRKAKQVEQVIDK